MLWCSVKDFAALQELLWSEDMFIEPEDSTITMCVCGLENQAKGNIKPWPISSTRVGELNCYSEVLCDSRR